MLSKRDEKTKPGFPTKIKDENLKKRSEKVPYGPLKIYYFNIVLFINLYKTIDL